MPVLAVLSVVAPSAVLLSLTDRSAVIDGFRHQYAKARYGLGACTAQSMDCSCFAQRLYEERLAHPIPRTTLTQAEWLAPYRVRDVRAADQLRDESLCVGDLIYTYQGRAWSSGSRHVAVYAGGGKVVHASRKNGGVGEDDLQWLHRFTLYGVYRPLGCENRSPSSHLGDISSDEEERARIRRLVSRYYATWITRDLDSYRRLWTDDAKKAQRGSTLELAEIMAKRRQALRGLRFGAAYHAVRSLGIAGNRAFVDVEYSLDLKYDLHRRELLSVKETLLLERDDRGVWKIATSEDLAGD